MQFRGAVFFLIAVMGLLLFDHDHHKENLAEYRILFLKARRRACVWQIIGFEMKSVFSHSHTPFPDKPSLETGLSIKQSFISTLSEKHILWPLIFFTIEWTNKFFSVKCLSDDTHSNVIKVLFHHVTNLTGLADHKVSDLSVLRVTKNYWSIEELRKLGRFMTIIISGWSRTSVCDAVSPRWLQQCC